MLFNKIIERFVDILIESEVSFKFTRKNEMCHKIRMNKYQTHNLTFDSFAKCHIPYPLLLQSRLRTMIINLTLNNNLCCCSNI